MDDVNIVDYSRQEAMDGSLSMTGTGHIIIGCGGVGFWLGVMLGMQGHDNIILMDGEKIEPSNLNRLPVPQTWVGMNKAVALRRLIRFMRPTTRIQVLSTHITPETLDLLGTLSRNLSKDYIISETIVWDTTDNARIQLAIHKAVKSIDSARYRKIGYEGWEVGNYRNYDVWYDEATYETGYRTSSANAVSSAMSAGLGYLAEGLEIKRDVTINMKKLLKQGGNNE